MPLPSTVTAASAAGFLAAFALTVACGDRSVEEFSRHESDIAVPSDVAYSLIESTTDGRTWRRYALRINNMVSEPVLRQIATAETIRDRTKFESVSVAFYLPGMPYGHGCWAIAEFNPGLSVKFFGLTIESKAALLSEPLPTGCDVIGQWMSDTYHVSKFTITVENSRILISEVFFDGSRRNRELIEKASSEGRLFSCAEPSKAGDCWLVRADGDLEIRDDEGVMAQAKRIH